MKKKPKNRSVAVLGLGRFGVAVVKTLAERSVDILVCDKMENHLHEVAGIVTHAVCGDISDEMVLASLELSSFDVVIIAIAEDFESALIAATVAKEQGAKRVIVKAGAERQKRILLSIGVDEVIMPENEMGMRLANRLTQSNVLEILGDSEHFILSEHSPYPEWIGRSIGEIDVRRKHGLTIIAIMRHEKLHAPVSPDWRFQPEDMLVILGTEA